MKKLFISLLILLCYNFSDGQRTAGSLQMQNDLLIKKSNSQKTWATVLTIGGGAALIAGIAVRGSNQSYVPNEEIGTALMVGGGAAVIGGIILFTAASRNKEKANSAAMQIILDIENTAKSNGIGHTYYPALAFRFRL